MEPRSGESSRCSEIGDGCHTSSVSSSVKPSALTLIATGPPAVVAAEAWATHPETCQSAPLDIPPSLEHVEEAGAAGVVPGRELTVAVRIALLTA